MSRSRLVAAGLLLGIGASAAWACGPFFPNQLLDDRAKTLAATPANSFAFDAMHLAPTPSDGLKPLEWDTGTMMESDWQAIVGKAEVGDLSGDQADMIAAMRDADTGDQAFDRGATLPAAVRLYMAGAVDFHKGDAAHAAERFDAVLHLPEDEQRSRAVWAAYMLGRIAHADGDADKAVADFALTRDLTVKGAPDPLGLAVASYGEEAKLHLDRAMAVLDGDDLPAADAAKFVQEIAAATTLYAEQAAHGSDSGVQSLRMIAETLTANPALLTASVGDPLIERLLVVYVLARSDDVDVVELAPDATGDAAPTERDRYRTTLNPLVPTLADAIEALGAAHPPATDRLAALAYRSGRYDLARKLAEGTPGPLAAWVKAKLALQKGDLAGAASYYAEASKAFPASDTAATLDATNTALLPGESGVVALARGEYVDALDKLYGVVEQYWGDVAHLADRVLTVDELKRFVDAKVPAGAVGGEASQDDDEGTCTGANSPPADKAAALRDLLARRLVRAGRYGEATAYFHDAALRQRVADYAKALDTAGSAWRHADRAQAWFAAAILARRCGMEMMGYEAAPDFFVWDGGLEGGLGQDKLEGPDITDGERQRYAASVAVPDKRYHYRYVAVTQAGQAADLLPPRSQAYAAVLCRATSWMLSSNDDQAVRTLYRRYVKHGAYVSWASDFGHNCPAPDFAGAARFTRIEVLRETHDIVSRYRWPLGAGLALVAVLLWVRTVRRRRPLSPPR